VGVVVRRRPEEFPAITQTGDHGWIGVLGPPMELFVTALDSQIGPKGDAASNDDAVDLSPRSLVIAGTALLIANIAVFFVFFRSQVEFAVRYPSDWGHTLIVPGLVGWLIWREKDRLHALQPIRPLWLGMIPVLLGLTFYFVSVVGPSWFAVHHNARQVGFAVTIFGEAILLLGWRATRVVWFPLAYWVVFGFTYTDRIISYFTYKLQDISASGGYFLLRVLNIDADIAGNTITVIDGMGNQNALNIAEACSGMRMLVAFMALGTLMAYVGLKAWWQRILLIALAVPVAVFVNMLRVATLGVLSLWDVGFAGGQFHAFIGFVWLVPAFLVFLGIMSVVQRLVVEVEVEETA
jgi:exosortase